MRVVKLREIGKIITGCTPSTKKSEYYSENNYMFVGPSDIKNVMYVVSSEKSISEKAFDDYRNRFIDENSIVVDCIGSDMGNVAIVKSKCLTNQQINAITNIDENQYNIKYIYYVLSTMKKYFHLIGTNGSTMPILNKTMFENIEIEVPNIEIQNKIASILSKLDDKIKLNNEINNNLYEMGDNLYYEYFGKYKDNLPFDYNIVKLNEVADNFDSKRKPMSSREREQHRGIYPYYGATSIIDYVDDYIFDDTYLLMGEDGTVKTDDGYPVLQYIWGKNWINNHAHVLKGKNISTELLMFALRKINIENIITGAVQPKINQENMNKIEFVIGPDSKNKELEVILKNLMDKSKNIIEENEKLSELRDTLLPKLMNGEIDLDSIEI